MKKQLFILCILLATLFTFGQNAELARAYYTKAKEAYSQQDYQQALKYLENAKEQLGSTNPDITYMEIKSKNGLDEFDEKMEVLIKDFLQKSDADDERRTEVNMLLIDLKEKRIAYQEAEKARKAEEVRKVEEAKKAEEDRKAEVQRNIEETKSILRQTMIKVEGGTFKMGDREHNNSKPVHKVTLSTFFIGKYPITQRQWVLVMGENATRTSIDNRNCKDCPMVYATWYEIQEFLKKLNEITGKKYRLPTEAEWEFAARGGNRSNGYTFSGSNNIDEVAWHYRDATDFDDRDNTKFVVGRIKSVGQKHGNELGIYDMSGNVFEWCNDWYDANYYKNSPKNNPQGPSSGVNRVKRGGMVNYTAQVHYRSSAKPSNWLSVYDIITGFRVVLSED